MFDRAQLMEQEEAAHQPESLQTAPQIFSQQSAQPAAGTAIQLRTSGKLNARQVRQLQARSGNRMVGRFLQGRVSGLPERLKRGVEALSGLVMDDVRVHYNSPKPAELQALAYTQGNQIYVGPGQEKHLPHEAWHVVQQAQGRVQPTMQSKGVSINGDESLEHEANVMGAEALHMRSSEKSAFEFPIHARADQRQPPMQRGVPLSSGSFGNVQMKKWVVLDGELVDPDDPGKKFKGSDAPKLEEGDTWDDKTGEITHGRDRMSAIFSEDDETVADRDDHVALIAQFEKLTAEGGLLMHAVAGGEEVESLGYLIEQGTPLSKIRMGDFRTKLLSYIRSDLTMKTFGFRRFGLLFDWRRIWDIVGAKPIDLGNDNTQQTSLKLYNPTIFEEDQQSSRTALDESPSFGEVGGSMGSMGVNFDQMARRQNALKETTSLANWNEILTFNAVTAGLVGVLWIRDETAPTQKEDYKTFFTEKKKAELYAAFTAKTGMKIMPIYLYTHMGNPRGDRAKEARKRLGKKGASSLVLLENYAPPISGKTGVKGSDLSGGKGGTKDQPGGAVANVVFHVGDKVRVRYHLHYDVIGVVAGLAFPYVRVQVTDCVVPGTQQKFHSDHTAIVLNETISWHADDVEIDTGH